MLLTYCLSNKRKALLQSTDDCRRKKEDMTTKRGNFEPDKQIWFEPSQKTILPIGAQLPIPQHVPKLMH